MLHRINISCEAELNWIVQLQRDLLSAVCQPDVNARTVAFDWIEGIRPDIDANWFNRFCNRKDKLSGIKRSLIEHLRFIADMPENEKQQILENFEHNQVVNKAFDPAAVQPHPLRHVDGWPNSELIQALRGFFTSFYDPNLYDNNGFPCPDGHNPDRFCRKKFLEQFQATNHEIGVCVLCDGDLGDPDIDHFYSKKVFPDLSCHPGNLVPICKSCNGRARKGEKPPMDKGVEDPIHNWFHPYYRSAEGTYTVVFKEKENKIWPVLAGRNGLDQKRLDNLDNLVGLSERWHQRLRHIVSLTINQLRKSNPDNLEDKLLELANNHRYEIKRSSGAILREGYYRRASEGFEPLLDEIRVELQKLDPVAAA